MGVQDRDWYRDRYDQLEREGRERRYRASPTQPVRPVILRSREERGSSTWLFVLIWLAVAILGFAIVDRLVLRKKPAAPTLPLRQSAEHGLLLRGLPIQAAQDPMKAVNAGGSNAEVPRHG